MSYRRGLLQRNADEDIVYDIVSTIADQTNTDVLSLPPLDRAIDTDALATLLQEGSASEIAFSFDGHDVTIDSDGQVSVTNNR